MKHYILKPHYVLRKDYVHEKHYVQVPFHMKCISCNRCFPEGRQLLMHHEEFGGPSTKLGVRIHRFYMKCSSCLGTMIFRSDLFSYSYVPEHMCYMFTEGDDVEEILKEKLALKEEKRRRSLNPRKLLKSYEVNPQMDDMIGEIEIALDELRNVEQQGKVITKDHYEQMAIIIRKTCNKLDRRKWMTWDDGKAKLSPFGKKLAKVKVGDFENFLKTVHKTLHTGLFKKMALCAEERLKGAALEFDKKRCSLPEVIKADGKSDDDAKWSRFVKAIMAQFEENYEPSARDVNPERRIVFPMTMKCIKCGIRFPKNSEGVADQETFGAESALIRIKIHRFHIKCPRCSSHLMFRSNFQQTGFIIERGLEYDEGEIEPSEDNTYFDIRNLLSACPKLTEEENGLIQIFEDQLEILNAAKLEGRDVDEILMTLINAETSIAAEQEKLTPVRLGPKFSDTLNAIPHIYFWRFLRAVRIDLKATSFNYNQAPWAGVPPCRSDLHGSRLTVIPLSVYCESCTNLFIKDSRVQMTMETIFGLDEHRFTIIRLYIRCPMCSGHITLRSENFTGKFRIESGGFAAVVEPDDVQETPDTTPAFDPIAIGLPPLTDEVPAWADDFEAMLDRYVILSDDDKEIKDLEEIVRKSNINIRLHTMCRQLRTEEFKKVMEEKSAMDITPVPLTSHEKTLHRLLIRYAPSPTYQYSNLFKSDRKRETDLRRPELVERRRKELNERKVSLKAA